MLDISDDVSKVVNSEMDITDRIALLNKEVFPKVVTHINEEVAPNRLSRRPKSIEPVPNHSRNLTEIRTRVGLLLEFNLGTVIEGALPDGHKSTYGTSQAHADLVFRDEHYQPTIRIEVKALEDIAEEKAANYKDLVHSTDPDRDILAIFVWGWQSSTIEGHDYVYPKIHGLEAFQMREISKARDLLWMRKSSGDKQNLVDIGGPVLQRRNGEIKKEEGNMGKLTRIVRQSNLKDNQDLRSVLDFEELRRYIRFISYCQGVGLQRAAEYYAMDKGLTITDRVDQIYFDRKEHQYLLTADRSDMTPLFVFSAGSRAVHSGSLVSDLEDSIRSQLHHYNSSTAEFLILENEKFSWTTGQLSDGEIRISERGDNLFGDLLDRTPI